MNQVLLVGRTTRDIELREASNGSPYGIATLAVSKPFKNKKTGEYDTDFVDVSLWGATAKNVAKYAGKGSILSVRGRLANRTVDLQGEQTMRTISIVGEQVCFVQTKTPELKQDVQTDEYTEISNNSFVSTDHLDTGNVELVRRSGGLELE